MPHKSVKIYGKKYRIVPSLKNMCELEAVTETNLILGINPTTLNLRFMKATIECLLEDERGILIEEETVNRLYLDDVGEAQRIFEAIFREMYAVPKEQQKKEREERVRKNLISLLSRFVRLWRRGS